MRRRSRMWKKTRSRNRRDLVSKGKIRIKNKTEIASWGWKKNRVQDFVFYPVEAWDPATGIQYLISNLGHSEKVTDWLVAWLTDWQGSVTTVAVDHHDDRYTVSATAVPQPATAVVTTVQPPSPSSSPAADPATTTHDASRPRSPAKTDNAHSAVSLRRIRNLVAYLFHGELWPPMSTILSTVN